MSIFGTLIYPSIVFQEEAIQLLLTVRSCRYCYNLNRKCKILKLIYFNWLTLYFNMDFNPLPEIKFWAEYIMNDIYISLADEEEAVLSLIAITHRCQFYWILIYLLNSYITIIFEFMAAIVWEVLLYWNH